VLKDMQSFVEVTNKFVLDIWFTDKTLQ